jgi:hypothetical protein
MARLSGHLFVLSGFLFLASCGKPEVPTSSPTPPVTKGTGSAPMPVDAVATPMVPTATKPPAPTDITCTGTYGTAPNLIVFFQNSTCWFTTSHGPDECSFTMDNKRVRISVSGYSTTGAFEDDCSKVHFGGLDWDRTGEAQDPAKAN